MTANESFDRRLAGWLESEAQGRVADHLAEVLVVTRATRQRRGWASLERWLPVASIAQQRFVIPRPLIVFVVLAALVAAVAGAYLLSIGRSVVPPIGGAGNGRIFYADGQTLVSVAADGSDRRVIPNVAGGGNLAMSPTGRVVAYTTLSGDRIELLSLSGAGEPVGAPIAVTNPGSASYGQITWDPMGERLAFVAAGRDRDHLYIANADGSDVHDLGGDAIADGMVVAWPAWSPDGDWLAFIMLPDGQPGTIELVHPDGSGHRTLQTSQVSTDSTGYLAWSPDPATPRLLYVTSAGSIRYVDLTTNGEVTVHGGFWPAWSPTGDRVAYWDNGLKVLATPVAGGGLPTPTEVFPSFTGACQDHPELAGKALCGPPIWSPDGTRLIGIDVSFTKLMAFSSSGSDDPIVLALGTATEAAAGGFFTWQPIHR